MNPNIEAHLTQRSFAVGEKILLTLMVYNPGPEGIAMVDPRRGGEHFRLRIEMAPGEWRVVTMASVLAAPGVPAIVTEVTVPVRNQWPFEFDLTAMTRLDQAGSYTLIVEYEWQPGQLWRSPPLPFQLVKGATGRLVVTPSEATESGYHALVWVEGDTGDARAFLLDFRIQQPEVRVEGAVQIAVVPTNSNLTLSMSPPGSPFPDRWVVWVDGDRVSYCYWARAPEERLPPAAFSIGGFQLELIQPALAGRAPDYGRPDCLVGLLLRSPGGTQLLEVQLAPQGQFRMANSQPLEGAVRGAWATSPTDQMRLFVFAVQTGGRLQILAVQSLRGAQSYPPVTWFSTQAEFLTGDIRLMPDGRVKVGLLTMRDGQWERVTFTSPDPGREPEPTATPLEQGPGATAVRVRLDNKGDTHTLFLRDEALHYAAPNAGAETWSHQRPITSGNSADLLIAPNGRVVLVYYDLDEGPTFLRI